MPKIILITHQKGGVGKSTLTFNLAQNLSGNAKVAVLDLDHQGSLIQIKKLVEGFTITSDESVLTEEHIDFVFIDTPPYLSDKLPELIKRSDLILVPTKAGVLDLLAIEGTLDLIRKRSKEKNTMIVLNMIKHNTTLTTDIIEELNTTDFRVASTHISDLVVFTRSVLLKGVESNPNAQRQIDGLTKEILTALL